MCQPFNFKVLVHVPTGRRGRLFVKLLFSNKLLVEVGVNQFKNGNRQLYHKVGMVSKQLKRILSRSSPSTMVRRRRAAVPCPSGSRAGAGRRPAGARSFLSPIPSHPFPSHPIPSPLTYLYLSFLPALLFLPSPY